MYFQTLSRHEVFLYSFLASTSQINFNCSLKTVFGDLQTALHKLALETCLFEQVRNTIAAGMLLTHSFRAGDTDNILVLHCDKSPLSLKTISSLCQTVQVNGKTRRLDCSVALRNRKPRKRRKFSHCSIVPEQGPA